MEQRIPEYPTEQQIKNFFETWKVGGESALLELIRKRRAEEETPENTEGGGHA